MEPVDIRYNNDDTNVDTTYSIGSGFSGAENSDSKTQNTNNN